MTWLVKFEYIHENSETETHEKTLVLEDCTIEYVVHRLRLMGYPSERLVRLEISNYDQ